MVLQKSIAEAVDVSCCYISAENYSDYTLSGADFKVYAGIDGDGAITGNETLPGEMIEMTGGGKKMTRIAGIGRSLPLDALTVYRYNVTRDEVIPVRLSAFLEEKNMSTYQCSQQSGIPYTTLLELVKEKTSIEKCTAETVYRLARVLGLSMDELYTQLHSAETRAAFETFKSNVCHAVKEKGDLDFIIDTLQADEVQKYWDRHWYPEAYYTLAMLDYLSRENSLPLCANYENIRRTSLKKPIFPRDIELAARLDPSLDVKKQAMQDSIPEFIRFNIVEKEVRNVC